MPGEPNRTVDQRPQVRCNSIAIAVVQLSVAAIQDRQANRGQWKREIGRLVSETEESTPLLARANRGFPFQGLNRSLDFRLKVLGIRRAESGV